MRVGGDELQGDLVLDAIDEQADVLPDVVQPSSAAGLVGVALGGEVEVGAGTEGEVLPGHRGDAGRGGEDQERLPARFVFRRLAVLVRIRVGLPGFHRLDVVVEVPGAGC